MDNIDRDHPMGSPTDSPLPIPDNDDLFDVPSDDEYDNALSEREFFIISERCGWPLTPWHMAIMPHDVVANTTRLAHQGLALVGWHLPLIPESNTDELQDMHRIARFLHYILACAAHGVRYRRDGFAGDAPVVDLPVGMFTPIASRVAQDCFMRVLVGHVMDMQLE